MIGFIQCYFLLTITWRTCNCQRVHDDFRSALFARQETIQKAEDLYKKVSQNVTTPVDKTVEHILQWLQETFSQNNRIAREETATSANDHTRKPNYTLKPQPFTVTKSEYPANVGYAAYNTYPTPQFNPYNNTQHQTSVNVPYQNNVYQTTPEAQYTYYFPNSEDINTKSDADDTNNLLSLQGSTGTPTFDDLTTIPIPLNNSVPKTDENLINELESSSGEHPPHIHSVDVQCSKDKMTINIEFNEVFNGIIYSKGFHNDPNCHYVMKNSGQIKYSFIVQLNSCGTQFVDEFYKGKQAFLENVLVLQNEPGIQEVWDTVRSVRCLWEGSIKQTLSAGLNVETLNQDVLTFSGDMVAARLEIQVGKGPNAPAANGLVKIGDTMTLVITVDGDSAFDVLVRSCVATDGNPTSGNLIQLTDEQGCILKPKLFGNFQMMKNPDINRPSVVAYAYFQAFKFPDVMDLLIECNVELCKSQCQTCTQQSAEPVRQKRLVHVGVTYPSNTTKFLSEKLHVFGPDDIKFVASRYNDLYADHEDQVCLSTTAFYLQNTVIAMFFFTSCIIIICFWLKLKKLTEKCIMF